MHFLGGFQSLFCLCFTLIVSVIVSLNHWSFSYSFYFVIDPVKCILASDIVAFIPGSLCLNFSYLYRPFCLSLFRVSVVRVPSAFQVGLRGLEQCVLWSVPAGSSRVPSAASCLGSSVLWALHLSLPECSSRSVQALPMCPGTPAARSLPKAASRGAQPHLICFLPLRSHCPSWPVSRV